MAKYLGAEYPGHIPGFKTLVKYPELVVLEVEEGEASQTHDQIPAG